MHEADGNVPPERGAMLGPDFFEASPEVVAPRLLGCVITSSTPDGDVAVRITEVEAYLASDPGSHAFRGKTARNAAMFGHPGHLYVYFTYGMHFCANLVCLPEGTAGGVLLRAGEVVQGLSLARARRAVPGATAPRDRDLARGPANLAKVLGFRRETHDGMSVIDADSSVRVTAPTQPVGPWASGPRVGVRGPGGDAGAYPWRFWLVGDPTVSAYRPAAPTPRTSARQRTAEQT